MTKHIQSEGRGHDTSMVCYRLSLQHYHLLNGLPKAYGDVLQAEKDVPVTVPQAPAYKYGVRMLTSVKSGQDREQTLLTAAIDAIAM